MATGNALGNRDVMSWVEDLLEIPMVILSMGVLALLAIEYLANLSPAQNRALTLAQWVIWVVFVIHFIVTFSLAPRKAGYMKRNWLVVISLVIPFLRVLTIFRAIRALRVLRTARLVALTNRAVRQIGMVFQARRIIFVTLSSLIVILVSATGLFVLERNAAGSDITSFGVALWFATRSVMNTDVPIAPVTGEGRFLGVLISLYGFAIFGVITAALASWFIEVDRRAEARRKTEEEESEASEEITRKLDSRPATDEELRKSIDRLIGLMKERQQETAREENA